MANPGSYGSTSTAPVSSSAPSVPNSTGSFPTSTTGEGLGVNGVQVANLSVTQFLSDYDISSTEENTYLSDNNGKLSLNENALMLMQYKAMDQSQRQDIQQSLVNAGVLTATDATGADTSAGMTAFKSAITTAATDGTDVNTYLQNYSGTNYAENELSSSISSTEKEAAAPTTVTQENPTTLSATITNAFNQALGYSPDQDQINSFISQIQGQDTANTMAPHEAAEQQLTQLKSDQSTLSKMGPNDIDSIITAYTNAIHGVNPAAGNTANQQGPQNGTQNASLPAGTVGPMGEQGPATTSQVPNTYSRGQEVLHNLNPQTWSGISSLPGIGRPAVQQGQPSGGTHSVTTPGVNQGPNLSVAPVAIGTTPTFGGIYALSPQDWAEAKKLMPNSGLPATPGAASPAVQETAFRTILQNLYDNNGGSWADAIVKVASGQTGSNPTVPKASLQTFATGIAANVEQQLTTLQNNIATQSVTVKTDQPDASAEASAAAKTADPVGYYASNMASGGELLNQMLAGAPQMYDNSSADTFTGPVTTAEAVSTPTASPASAPAGSSPAVAA